MNIIQSTFLLLLISSGVVFAQQPPAAPTPKPPSRSQLLDEQGLTGVVVNQTFTRQGQDFYRLFTQGVQEQELLQTRLLSVVEKPSRRSGNRITVFSGQTLLFEGILPFKIEKLASFTTQVLDSVTANLAAMIIESSEMTGADMAPNEL
jgi:hypothetical protein